MAGGVDTQLIRLLRTGTLETNPTQFIQRANTFAASIARGGAATLLARRDATGLRAAALLDAKAVAANATLNLAHAVGARAEPGELPTDLADVPAIGHLVHTPSVVLRETQAGIDPGELPRLLANAMPEDSWVAVTMRSPSNKERKRHSAWLAHRLGTAVPTHHSTGTNAMVATITAGGPGEAEVEALLAQVAAGLPGFDLETETVFPRTRHRAWAGLPAALALAAAAVIGVPLVPAAAWAYAPFLHAWAQPLLFAAAALAGVVGAAAWTGRLPSPDTLLRRSLARGVFPAPPARAAAPAAPRKESTVRKHNPDGSTWEKHISASDGDYPLAPSTFLVGPSVVTALVSPHAGAISGAAATAERTAPPAVREDIGPVLGETEDGPVHLSAAALLFGTAIVGLPGGGKSVLVRTLFGWHCLERVNPSGRPGYPGRANTLIAFESKGDGVARYQQWAAKTGDTLLVVDAGDMSTPAIDLFAVDGDDQSRAVFFVNAMQYAFGHDAIGDRSFETLCSVFTAALTVDDDLLAGIDGLDPRIVEPGRSPIYYAHILLGGRGDQAGVDLANGIRAHATRMRERGTPDARRDKAWMELMPLYDGKTESNRRTFVEAPRNKVSAMLDMEYWWAPVRPRVSWAEILERHLSVVVNTGSSTSGRVLEENQNHILSSMLMFGLRHAVIRTCSGWLEMGRSVTVFADELALLAGTSHEIVAWIRDQGRSFGLRAVLATQRPEQLGQSLRNNFLTYQTLISFAQSDVTTSNEIASNAGGDWTGADVQHLEPYQVLVRTAVDQRRQPAFTVKLPYWEDDVAGFAVAQGYAEQPAPVGGKPWLA